MKTGSQNSLSVKFLQAKMKKRCMECGSRMEEEHRSIEGGITYIWYRCSDKNCSGQLLNQKV